jgi:hypothetical protein
MSADGTLKPVDVALYESGIETKPSFARCVMASLTKLIADIARDTEDAAESLSSRAWKPSRNRAEVRNFRRLWGAIWANTASERRLTTV